MSFVIILLEVDGQTGPVLGSPSLLPAYPTFSASASHPRPRSAPSGLRPPGISTHHSSHETAAILAVLKSRAGGRYM